MQRYSPGSKYKPILIKDMEIEKESERNVLYNRTMKSFQTNGYIWISTFPKFQSMRNVCACCKWYTVYACSLNVLTSCISQPYKKNALKQCFNALVETIVKIVFVCASCPHDFSEFSLCWPLTRSRNKFCFNKTVLLYIWAYSQSLLEVIF